MEELSSGNIISVYSKDTKPNNKAPVGSKIKVFSRILCPQMVVVVVAIFPYFIFWFAQLREADAYH